MARVRVSTTVDQELLEQARQLDAFATDASLIEAALQALLHSYRSAEIDAAYASAYAQPLEASDDWGKLDSFLDAAARA